MNVRRGRPLERGQAGFTLAEVLLTLLIMAGIMLTITQILTDARTKRDEIHNRQERRLAGPAILSLLESDLRALFTFGLDPHDHLRVADRVLSGYDADSIDFITGTDSLIPYREGSRDDFVRADVNEVGYRLRPHPTSDDFLELYRREDFGVDDDVFEGGQYSLLHDRVKGFSIEVYDEDGPDAEPLESWGTSQDDSYGVPVRVHVQLTIELAPRLIREQLVSDPRTVTYERIFRFPEILRVTANQIEPALAIPSISAPTADAAGLDGATDGSGPDSAPGAGGQQRDGGDAGGGMDNPFGGGGDGGGSGTNPFGGG